MEKKLNDFNIGEIGIVKSISGEGQLRRRLFDMGVTPGAEIFLRKRAPLGDPIEITLRGYELTLRKKEAELVTLEMTHIVSSVAINAKQCKQKYALDKANLKDAYEEKVLTTMDKEKRATYKKEYLKDKDILEENYKKDLARIKAVSSKENKNGEKK